MLLDILRYQIERLIYNIDTYTYDMDSKCAFCKGEGNFMGVECGFCNGSGEPNRAAESYVKKEHHTCGCAASDRKNCPICNGICHHTGSQSPKIIMSPM